VPPLHSTSIRPANGNIRPGAAFDWSPDDVLLHGTLRRHRASILRRGLVPGVGPLVREAYEFEIERQHAEPVPLVFARLPWDLDTILCYICRQGRILGEDIFERGMIAVVPRAAFTWADRTLFRAGNLRRRLETDLFAVEPGDWYAREVVWPIELLAGERLRALAGGRATFVLAGNRAEAVLGAAP
jgi:hypothetical protein